MRTERDATRETAEAGRHPFASAFLDALAGGVVVHDRSGRCVASNPVAAELLGVSSEVLAGRSLDDPGWALVAEDGFPLAPNAHPAMATLRLGTVERAVFGTEAPEGGYRWLATTSRPMFDRRGQVSHAVSSIEDVTARKDAEASLRERLDIEQLLGAISGRFARTPVEETDAAIETTLADLGNYLAVDRVVVHRFEPGGDLLVHTHWWSAPDAPDRRTLPGPIDVRALAHSSQAITVADRPWMVGSSDDFPDDWHLERAQLTATGVNGLCIFPLLAAGRPGGMLVLDTAAPKQWPPSTADVVRSVGEVLAAALDRRETAEALLRGERALAAAQAQAHVGHWTMDPASDRITFSDELFRILGHEPGGTDTDVTVVLEQIAPQDRDLAVAFVEDALAGRSIASTTFRIRRPDGEERVLHSEAHADRYLEKDYAVVLGTVQDITARVRSEDALRRSEARYRALVAGVPDLIMRLDSSGVFVDIVPSTEIPTVRPIEEIVGCHLRDVVPSIADRTLDAAQTARATGQVQTFRYTLPELGSAQQFEARVVPLDEDEFLVLSRDVTSEALYAEQLEHAARHDPLTGLPNRTLFLNRLAHALRRTERAYETIALVIIDLDGFKTVNDTYGHLVGDEVLREAARRVATVVRVGDTPARWGGDEFVVLLENLVDDQRAKQIADRILRVVALPYVLPSGRMVRITTSAGLALPCAGDDADTIISRADRAMYRAKEAGRGRWFVAES